ncbi:FISUMP domain-containing protein [Bacteroides caecimuris]|uniref:FISUMP domain-containing protein n=1 Tax=Bacteroides caecimuris TaxID=1796613 RepID=UPI0025727F41|nr:FISUMP domain-containing protein [Bacteroides caecimuris]
MEEVTTSRRRLRLEYLKNDHIASRAVVIYTGQGGAADYTRGLVAYLVDDNGNMSAIDNNGGTVAFNYDENTLDYAAGNSNAVQTVYLSAFGITTEEQENAVEVVAEPYLVADISGNSYPTVKIGSEVWLGTNLRTTKFGDGTEIPFSAMNSLNQQVASYTYPGGDSDIDTSLYGYLYTSKVVADEDLIAGSIVDGLWRISTGGGNNSNGLMGNVTDWQRLFKYIGQDQLGTLLAPGHNWNNGGNGAFDINTVSNLTGLGIVPAGQIYSNGSFALGYLRQAFFFYGNAGQGYNLAERDGKAVDQAGVRQWNHATDACSIRLVRIDNHQ